MSKPLSKLFVGYASSDKAMLEELLPYLEVFERTGQASVWCDRNIKLGAPWAASIDEALATCDVALLLVSQKFIVSDFIRTVEVPRLLARWAKGEIAIAPLFVAPVMAPIFDYIGKNGQSATCDLTDLQGFKPHNTPHVPLTAIQADPHKLAVCFKEVSQQVAKLLAARKVPPAPVPPESKVALPPDPPGRPIREAVRRIVFVGARVWPVVGGVVLAVGVLGLLWWKVFGGGEEPRPALATEKAVITGAAGGASEVAARPEALVPGPVAGGEQEPPEDAAASPQVSAPAAYTTGVGGLRMVAVAGGEFSMGSPEAEVGRDGDEGPQHRVRVGGLWVGETEVTQAQWKAVMGAGSNPSHHQGDTFPVENVTWYQAVEFCNALSKLEGKTPAYQIDGTKVKLELEADGYRLPTEAEWEYFARAGTTTRYSFGDEESKLGEYGWYTKNSSVETRPVKTRQPNPWGLYDVHGNVWEWCWDGYANKYTDNGSDIRSGSVSDNPIGPPNSEYRVLRGGSAWVGARNLRSADRSWGGPGVRNGNGGFRVVRSFARQHR